MKKQIITGIGIIAYVALCAAVWPRNAEVENLPAESAKTAVTAEFEARSEEAPPIIIPVVASASEPKPVAESEPVKNVITAEEKTELMSPAEPAFRTVSKFTSPSTEPKPGERTVIDGKPHVWIPGFGWIVDEGGGSVGTTVGNPGGELTGKKVGIMGGGTNVDDKGDINKQVGIMGGGTVAEDMYENGHKIGIMGDEESTSHETTAPVEPPEPTGDVIYIELQPPVTKDSNSPPYKTNGEPTNP